MTATPTAVGAPTATPVATRTPTPTREVPPPPALGAAGARVDTPPTITNPAPQRYYGDFRLIPLDNKEPRPHTRNSVALEGIVTSRPVAEATRSPLYREPSYLP